jgi:hypothetical protein
VDGLVACLCLCFEGWRTEVNSPEGGDGFHGVRRFETPGQETGSFVSFSV